MGVRHATSVATNHPRRVLRTRSAPWDVCRTVSHGPIQIVLLGFETTERFRGEIARELADLRGRGMIRVLDARLFHRSPDGQLTEVDLNPVLADPPPSRTGRSRTCSGPTAPAATAARARRPRRSRGPRASRSRTCGG